VRLDKYTKSDGSESYSIEFTRINECRSLDGRDDAPARQPAAESKPARPAPPTGGGSGDDEPPFMRRQEIE
jgi:hypothetical protein